MNFKEQHDFIFNYEFEAFCYEEGFIIDGTSDDKGCDLFINLENSENCELVVTYQEGTIVVSYNGRMIESFEFSENFEKRLWEIYQALKK
jgi:hypothetical protein